ncbi:hypothetical protein BHE18_03480 [Rossellomorea aquimaris]|uniref:Uncharacterized protein n=2 Tax=Rossellomorea aquimaris TaxID=189382 RepID=A0A1J6WXK9_9BACI|nr:hypothetical protein BHE18_03480 [Rossellomorea aquimaris]
MRKIGGYGAALAVMPYLLIKIVWTLGLLIPTGHMGDPNWRMVNAVTAVVAAIGIFLAIALCRPWGERLPAWSVALPVWIGTGLLVPMLFLAPILGPAAVNQDQAAGSADIWTYEQVLIMLSLIGVGICLPVALAGYAKTRWPEALGGPLHTGEAPGNSYNLQITLGRMVAAGCVILGVLKLFWAAGGTIGIIPSMIEDRNLWWHLLTLSTGVWALAGAWGILVLTSRKGSRRFPLPMAAAWISSGMLFSYNIFANLSELMYKGPSSPEYPIARVMTTEAGIILGVAMILIILMVLHDRRREE